MQSEGSLGSAVLKESFQKLFLKNRFWNDLFNTGFFLSFIRFCAVFVNTEVYVRHFFPKE